MEKKLKSIETKYMPMAGEGWVVSQG